MQRPSKGRRFLRRFIKITGITLVLLLSTLYSLLQLDSVQTWLGKKISERLARDLKTKIAIHSVRISFFKTVHLEGVYVEDLHRDTLLYGNNIDCEIGLLSFTRKRLELELTELSDITFKLQQYKGEKDLNLQFLVDYFSGPPDNDTTRSDFKIEYGDLRLNNVNFAYRNHNDTARVDYGMNFSDLHARHISGLFSNIEIHDELIRCQVKDLALTEKSGLRIRKLYAETTISPKSIRADNLYLVTDNSYLHGYYQMHTDSFGSYANFAENVKLAVKLTDSSYVNPIDISYFVRVFKGFDERIQLSGTFSGPLSHLRSGNLKFSAYEYTGFSGSFDIKGLPNTDSTYVKLNASRLSTHYSDLVRVPAYPFDAGKSMQLPANLRRLGKVTFAGKAEGYLNDLFMSGVFNTSLGQLIAHATVRTPKDADLEYNGYFKTNNFNLGAILEAKDLGEISLTAKVKGKGTTPDKLEADIEGQIQSCRYNRYLYRNMEVDGAFRQKKFSGHFSSADTNANFRFVGNADFGKKIPEMDAEISVYKFDLFKTNFVKDTVTQLAGTFNAQFSGQSIDDINGSVQANNVKVLRSNGLISLDNTDIEIVQNEEGNSLSMISSVLDAEVSGKFQASTLPASLSNFLHTYFPTFFKEKETRLAGGRHKKKTNSDQFKFRVRVKDFEPVAKFLRTPLMLSPNTVVQGSFDAHRNALVASGIADSIVYNKTPVKDWFLSVTTAANRQVNLNTGFKRVDLGDSLYLGNFDLTLNAADNTSGFKLLWDNQTAKKNSGEISGQLMFSQYYLDVDIQRFLVYAQDSLWKREGTDHLFADSSGTINFSDFTFVNGSQRIRIEGVVSKNPDEQVTLELQDVRLNQLNPILKRKGAELDGVIFGTATLSDIYKRFIFSSALKFRELKVNTTLVGTGEINSHYDEVKKIVSLNGYFRRDFMEILQSSYNNINFDGYYYPMRKDSSLDVNVHLTQFAIATLQPFVKGIFTLKQGHLNGNVAIKGSFARPLLRGALELAEVKGFKVDYLNAPYEIRSGKIKIEPDEITLDFIPIYDVYGNKGTVYGNVFHDNFTNIKLDFDINVTNFMALNTTALQNSSYYGKAFCTGNIGLYGPPDALNFEINAKTAKGTQFYIPLAGPGEVSENGFIRFVKPDSLRNKSDSKNDFAGITLKFNLEVYPNAEVQILLDPKSGDAIKAKGIGTINMNISTYGNFEMFGTYDILDGSYLFTLENVINKKFDIDEGSSIRWSGDPLNADIDITATYRQRTSLAAFFPQSQTSNDPSAATGAVTGTSSVDNTKRYPVDCKLYMRDKLLTPDITFGIELPAVSEVIRSQVMGYINNEQELNRQVFSLLLLRTFVTPLQLTNTSGISAGEAAGNNASELLSNQLNNWLSNFTKMFNMGVNYRPGGAQSNEELDVNVSTQLFNDKLSIDGNVGVNNNAQTKTSTLIGDLNINYKLTPDGKVQLKAFNRSNDNFQIATLGGQFTQGAGVFYREEFNTLNDLYKRYVNFLSRKKKKQQQTAGN
jgi:hypothetical protein